ncbi:hypothetical protein D1BOALGB6SA_10467 [Olavius sp. associated proteobacterium Delta 1]|nr:hypothetical protein D1BOALGB6SA_10467 [Olavius sp. associated proteobacterium Delta 1]
MPLQIEFRCVRPERKQNAFGHIHPKASQILKIGNLAVLALSGFRSMVLRRHLSVTLPFR